jgi:predicted membrane-bound mannosyltransferase
MGSVMQNPLPDHDVSCVPFVIPAGVQIAVVFRERRRGDDDAQTMTSAVGSTY